MRANSVSSDEDMLDITTRGTTQVIKPTILRIIDSFSALLCDNSLHEVLLHIDTIF